MKIGKVCEAHPALVGKRHNNGTCIGCQREHSLTHNAKKRAEHQAAAARVTVLEGLLHSALNWMPKADYGDLHDLRINIEKVLKHGNH